jgi:O-antigen/teichoic acid export membrane protein
VIEKIKQRLLGKGGLRRELAQGALGSMALKVLFTGITFANVVLMARLLGPDGYGIVTFVLAIVSVLTIPSQFGIPMLAIRELAAARAHGKWGLMRGFVRRAHQAIAVFSAILLLTAIIVMLILRDRLETEKLETLAWGLLLVPLLSLAGLRSGMLKGLRKVLLGQLPEQLIRPGLLLVALLVVIWGFPAVPLSAAQTMVLQVVAAAAAFLAGTWIFWRVRPREMIKVEPQYQTRLWLASTVPLGLTIALRQTNGQTDILLLGMLASDAEVGLFRVADQIAVLVLFGQQVIGSVLAPYFAHMHAAGEHERLQRMVMASSRVILALTFPVVLLLIAFGKPVLGTFFGSEFEAAYGPLVILCLGQLLNASMGPVGLLLNMTGHERAVMLGIGISVAVNIVFNVILIPLYGMYGAAITTVLTLATWNLILRRQVRQRLGIETSVIFGLITGRPRR